MQLAGLLALFGLEFGLSLDGQLALLFRVLAGKILLFVLARFYGHGLLSNL
jgi:hypothetical protein